MNDCNKYTRTNIDCYILLIYGLSHHVRQESGVNLFTLTSLTTKQNVYYHTNVYKRFLNFSWKNAFLNVFCLFFSTFITSVGNTAYSVLCFQSHRIACDLNGAPLVIRHTTGSDI